MSPSHQSKYRASARTWQPLPSESSESNGRQTNKQKHSRRWKGDQERPGGGEEKRRLYLIWRDGNSKEIIITEIHAVWKNTAARLVYRNLLEKVILELHLL